MFSNDIYLTFFSFHTSIHQIKLPIDEKVSSDKTKDKETIGVTKNATERTFYTGSKRRVKSRYYISVICIVLLVFEYADKTWHCVLLYMENNNYTVRLVFLKQTIDNTLLITLLLDDRLLLITLIFFNTHFKMKTGEFLST